MRQRSHCVSALAGGLLAAVLMLSAPAVAGVGDAILGGKVNDTGNKTTRIEAAVADGPGVKITNEAGGPRAALRVDVPPGTPPFATNSEGRVKKFNADQVDGLHGDDLVKASELLVASDHEDLPDNDNRSLDADLNVPTAGTLLVNSSFDLTVSQVTVDSVNCSVRHGANAVTATEVADSLMKVSAIGANPEAVCTNVATIPVQAGPQHVDINILGVGGTTLLGDGQLQVLFVPSA